MFCPNCGEKENNPVQFCRNCGANLGVVRDSLKEADSDAASAINAREEIARAAAAKIRDGEWWQVGQIVPEVEKLFLSPSERRLQRQREDEKRRLRLLRNGTITAAAGFGLILLFLIASLAEESAFLLTGPALLVLFIGLGIIVNGLFFSVSNVPDESTEKSLYDKTNSDAANQIAARENEPKVLFPAAQPVFEHLSVTENTTRQLSQNSLAENRDTSKIAAEKQIEN